MPKRKRHPQNGTAAVPLDQTSPRDAVINLMKAAVPERSDEIAALWKQYDVPVVLEQNANQIVLNANEDRIAFDSKTMQVFWLIGFSGWYAIECYSPHVVWSAASGQPVSLLLASDEDLFDVERAYKERLAAVQRLIETADAALAPWPPDVPRPVANRQALANNQHRATYDLTCSAVAFTLFHEFRHVMLARDKTRPKDLREEELNCDVWARDFMTAKLADYGRLKGFDYREVLRRRAMAFSLAALIFHEIMPVLIHGGSKQYFSLATRMQAILDGTKLTDDDPFWVFTASLLIGIFRQNHLTIDSPALSPVDLTRDLIGKL